MNTQELILGAIATAVDTKDGLVLTDDRTYANVGTLRTIRRDTLEQVGSVTYDFQSGYCHFGPCTDRVAALWYGQSADGKAHWVKGSIGELVSTVVDHLCPA